MSRRNLYNKRFGKLVVKCYAKADNGRTSCICVCDCGKTKQVMPSNLRNGSTKSCGCIKIKHGDTGTKLYGIWIGMRRRCRDITERFYNRYGGRGITICNEWEQDYNTFKEWALDAGYKEGLSIDRIDNDGNYEPSNCRWITVAENSRRVIVDLQERVKFLEKENSRLKLLIKRYEEDDDIGDLEPLHSFFRD